MPFGLGTTMRISIEKIKGHPHTHGPLRIKIFQESTSYHALIYTWRMVKLTMKPIYKSLLHFKKIQSGLGKQHHRQLTSCPQDFLRSALLQPRCTFLVFANFLSNKGLPSLTYDIILNLLLLIPVVPQLRHMQEKLISAQTSDTAGHDPWGMFPIIFSDQLLKELDVLIGPLPFACLHFVTLCENKCHWYLKHTEYRQKYHDKDCNQHCGCN